MISGLTGVGAVKNDIQICGHADPLRPDSEPMEQP
jgi:hypothetical protein